MSDHSYYRRLLAAAALACTLYLIWRLSFLLLLLFAAILLATLLTGLAGVLAKRTFLSRRWAVAIITVGLVVLLGGGLLLFGARVEQQFAHVFYRAPEAIDAAGSWLGIPKAADQLAQVLSSRGIRYVPQAASVGYALVSAASQAVLVVVGAICLAADPTLYCTGLAKLFPHRMRSDVLGMMTTMASALRLWFLGQLLSMVLVGVLSAIAFTLIGLPIPLALGAIAGITNFVPIAGPFLGSVPAVLFAFTKDPSTVAWTVGLIFVIQQIDGNIASPLIQRQVVLLPPAVLLFALVGLGIVFGWLGFILAAPITVAAMVAVQKLWVREVIGEDVKVAGE